MESQDSVELRFAVDPTPTGRARSYLAATTGWYRIHTSESADPDWALADRLVREPRAPAIHGGGRSLNRVGLWPTAVSRSAPRRRRRLLACYHSFPGPL